MGGGIHNKIAGTHDVGLSALYFIDKTTGLPGFPHSKYTRKSNGRQRTRDQPPTSTKFGTLLMNVFIHAFKTAAEHWRVGLTENKKTRLANDILQTPGVVAKDSFPRVSPGSPLRLDLVDVGYNQEKITAQETV